MKRMPPPPSAHRPALRLWDECRKNYNLLREQVMEILLHPLSTPKQIETARESLQRTHAALEKMHQHLTERGFRPAYFKPATKE